MTLTRPRKARILEKAGLRYVAAWLPAKTAEALQPEIAEGEKIAADTLAKLDEKNRRSDSERSRLADPRAKA